MKKRYACRILGAGSAAGRMTIQLEFSSDPRYEKRDSIEFHLDDSDLTCLMWHIRKALEERQKQLEYIRGVVK